ncbi:MAG: glutathione S-transferase [Pseudomonadota bacterium]
MTHQIAIISRSYSSWSMRIGLLVERFELPVTFLVLPYGGNRLRKSLEDFAPATTVPVMKTDEGVIVTESLAIAEELASRFPDRGLWPSDPAVRGVLRGLSAEMHAGFIALRSACPMNLRRIYTTFEPSAAVLDDLQRIEKIWETTREQLHPFGVKGPWLGGAYSIADAFFAPVAARIAGYRLPVGPSARTYVDAHLGDSHFRRWQLAGLSDGPDIAASSLDLPYETWTA